MALANEILEQERGFEADREPAIRKASQAK